MKNLTYLILFLSTGLYAQMSSPKQSLAERIENPITNKKIKVYLLGSFHFAITDSSYNVMDLNHQESIKELCDLIAIQKPDKVFAERQPEYEFQNKVDSIYSKYLSGEPLSRKNEIYQVGFRVAKKLNHQKIYQCDHPGQFGFYSSNAYKYAEEHNQLDVLSGNTLGTTVRYDDMVNEDSIMKNNTLLDYMRWINSDKVMQTSHASYLTNFTQVGSKDFYDYDNDDTLIGAELTSNWYHRNIMIYAKIINQLDYSEDAIFLVIGAEHVPTIQSFFDANPYFEVIDHKDWLF